MRRDLVVVNTCGFIDAAVEESLAAVARRCRNGKASSPAARCQARRAFVRAALPRCCGHRAARRGRVLTPLRALPRPHDPFVDLLPPQGISYAAALRYLKISEGCNHRCTFCIIPSMRGDLVSRARRCHERGRDLFKAGVRELLVVSQDPVPMVSTFIRTASGAAAAETRMTELVGALAALAKEHGAWVRLTTSILSPLRRVVPLMSGGGSGVLPYLDPLPARKPQHPEADEAPANTETTLERFALARDTPVLDHTFDVHRRLSGETRRLRELSTFLAEAELDRVGCFAYSPSMRVANGLPGALPEAVKEERRARLMTAQAAISARRLRAQIGRTLDVLVDATTARARFARGAAKRRRSTAWCR